MNVNYTARDVYTTGNSTMNVNNNARCAIYYDNMFTVQANL